MKLAIISHTEHYKTANGTIVGWSPTVNEINHLLEIFESIIHVAMLYDGEPPKSTMAYCSTKIRLVPIPSVGGHGILNKSNIIFNAPKVLGIVSKVLKDVDCFQLRTPTGIGVFLIPYLTFFTKKNGWFKYAGQWNQKHPPLGYRLQRFMLKHQKRKVTINGFWEHQPKHCLTFENPCLTDRDIAAGIEIIQNKTFIKPLTFCFVGRLEAEKGVGRIIKAMALLSESEKENIALVHMVGIGNNDNYFQEMSKNIGVQFVFHGAMSRGEVFEIYKKSHVFLLPTKASEGFPKVIAEAMNFGCIPLVSDLSSISHYIEHQKNGFLLKSIIVKTLKEQILEIIALSEQDCKRMLENQEQMLYSFSFSNYNQRILTHILN